MIQPRCAMGLATTVLLLPLSVASSSASLLHDDGAATLLAARQESPPPAGEATEPPATRRATTAGGFVGEVSANDVYVRSGPSTNHYPVCKLRAGDRVTVVGESDTWYEILPPEGVFSLISGEFVDRAGAGAAQGVVNGDHVRVRAGSSLPEFASQRSHTQLQLSRGAEVTILSESPDGFLRIVPPRGVTVFISRDYVRRADGATAVEAAAVSSAERSVSRQAPPVVEPAKRPTSPATGQGRAGLPSELADTPMSGGLYTVLNLHSTPYRIELVRLDAQARDMLARPLEERDFVRLIEDYGAVAAQEEDDFAREYATARLSQLRGMQGTLDALSRVRALSIETEERRRDYLADRSTISEPLPPAPTGFDVQGEVRLSALYPQGTSPRRYRLVRAEDGQVRTIAYIEIPDDSSLDVTPYLGQYVGIRASVRRIQRGNIDPIATYVVREIVPLAAPRVAPRPAPAPGGFSDVREET